MLVSDDAPKFLCQADPELFFSPDEDARTEIGRSSREKMCKLMCRACPERIRCLEGAMVNKEYYGVWGGMGEGERRKFRQHLRDEGYRANEIPHGLELYASARQFDIDEALAAAEAELLAEAG